MMKLDFTPRTCCWIHPASDPQPYIAVTDTDSPKIYIFDGHGTNEPVHIIDKLHSKPVIKIAVSRKIIICFFLFFKEVHNSKFVKNI